jgi:hypothetical protein
MRFRSAATSISHQNNDPLVAQKLTSRRKDPRKRVVESKKRGGGVRRGKIRRGRINKERADLGLLGLVFSLVDFQAVVGPAPRAANQTACRPAR